MSTTKIKALGEIAEILCGSVSWLKPRAWVGKANSRARRLEKRTAGPQTVSASER